MHLYGLIILREFAAAHPQCRGAAAAWEQEVKEAEWTTARPLQERHATAQIGSDGQVVFDLLVGPQAGLYLLGTKVRYDKGIVLVERAWLGGQPPKAATRASKK
ncbi:MAG TPA: hypothetical protein VN280_09970 [Variovorax sp.]|nr:hypothetical protein [Variovorax sp.]